MDIPSCPIHFAIRQKRGISMKHTFRTNRLLALALALIMVISMFPVQAFAAGQTITGNPEQVKLGADAAAQRVNDFNLGWKFYLGDNSAASNQSFDDSAWDSVNLPHDFSITQHFTNQQGAEGESGFLPGGTGWYRKSFVISEETAGKTFLLNFDGVYMNAYVYVNGIFVGEHHYGYTSFAFDITEHLVCDGATQNVVAVKAVNELPSSRWYSGSGIYRDVTLYALDPVHVDLNGVTITTPEIADGSGSTEIKVDVVNDGITDVDVTVKSTVYFGGEAVAEGSTEITAKAGAVTEAALGAGVDTPALWSIDDPNLYTLKTEVIVGGDVVDSCEDTYGYRWFEFKTSGFYLNGEAVKLNGVCMHHDQGGLGAAAYYDAMYRQLSIMKDMGANAIRTSHNPADEQYIQICNELGLLVIEESFDGLVDSKNSNSKDFARYFEKDASSGLYGFVDGMTNAEYAARSMVKRDKNAPSIFAWSFGNEIQEGTGWQNVARYDEICADYISWVNDEDGTRIVTSGCNNRGSDSRLVDVINTILDAGGVAGFNYANAISGGSDRDLSALAQRFGGQHGSIIASETASHTNSRGQYKNQNNNGNSDGKYHVTSYDTSAVGWGITAHDSIYNTYNLDQVAGEFVWTGFDYIGEPTPWNDPYGTGNGAASNYPNSSYFGIVETTGFAKDSYYLYRAQWNKNDTTVHLVTAWDADNQMLSGGKTPVWLYSNAAKVELYLNDALIGTATRTANTSDAGHTYYTYSSVANDSGVCSVTNGYGADALYAVFNVKYTAGTLTAKAYDENGTEIALDETCGRYTVTTPEAASQIVATADKTEINADNQSLVYVEIDLTDANGNLKTTAANNLTFTVEGPAEIAAVDNGDQATVRKFQNSYVLTDRQNGNINAYAGKALVILRATDEGGEIKLTIGCDGMANQVITVNAVSGGESADEGLVSYEMVRDYTIMAGTAPELDTAITGYLADGTAVTGTITWRTVSEDLYTEAGDYTITGTASFEGYGEIRVSARLHVIANVVALRNVAAATMEGAAPTLPGMVSGILADGTLSGEFAVEWDAVDASEFDVVGETVVVNGTAVVFGDLTLPVTCSVRVAEAVNTESTNVAPQAETLTQDIPENYWSDNLSSITNGYKQFVDNTNERWTNWNYRTQKDNATLTLTWATAQSVAGVNLYYYYDNCCAYPESVEFSYSINNVDYEVIAHTAEEIESAGLGAMYAYTFEKPISPVGLKVKLTQQDGTSGAHCVGLIELEVMTYAATLETHSTAALSAIMVDGTVIEGFAADTYAYDIADGEITVEATENVGITVLPEYKGHVYILTVSEDGSDAKLYDLSIEGKACKHENTEVLPAVDPTCTRDGLTEGIKCADCGEILTKQETVPALGHTEEVVPGTPATFDEDGLSDGLRCSVCGTILAQQEPVPALDYNEGIVPIEVLTATAGDWQRGYEATEGPAELVLDDDFSTIWHTDWYGTSRENHWIQFELSEAYIVDGLRLKPRQGGGSNGIITKYDIQVSNDGETFTSVASGDWEGDRLWKEVKFNGQNVKYVRLVALDGVTDQAYVFASAAEIRLTGRKADVTPHDCVYESVVTAPTCTEGGYTTYTCTICGESYTADETEALGHEYESVVTAPTCTKGGYTTHTCVRCGDSYTSDETAALGHTPAEAVKENEKAASCFEDGSYDSVVYCSVCGEELSREPITVPASHNTVVRDAYPATCTKDGYTGDTWCLDCGRRLSVGEAIPAAGHDYEDGTCVNCGEKENGAAEPENPFTDVPNDAYYAEAVLWAVENGITDGTSATTFSPADNCLRAHAVTFLWRAAGSPEPASTNNPFVDVKETDFFYKAVLWAAEKGITTGVDATHFGPALECNRATIVTFLYRAVGAPEIENRYNPFTDLQEDAYYFDAVLWAVENGVTSGVSAELFAPGQLCNRAQIVTFLYRAYK